MAGDDVCIFCGQVPHPGVPCPASPLEVWNKPKTGDLLAFDGIMWRVSRREGWHYYVEQKK